MSLAAQVRPEVRSYVRSNRGAGNEVNAVKALLVTASVYLPVSRYQVRDKVSEADLKEVDGRRVAADPFIVVVDDGQECANHC